MTKGSSFLMPDGKNKQPCQESQRTEITLARTRKNGGCGVEHVLAWLRRDVLRDDLLDPSSVGGLDAGGFRAKTTGLAPFPIGIALLVENLG